MSKSLLDKLHIVINYLDCQHYGWFLTGALRYEYYITKNKPYWFSGVLVGFIVSRSLAGKILIPMLVANSLLFIFAYSLIPLFVQRYSDSFLPGFFIDGVY